MKPFYLFAPIRRVDESERTVEGYAFVREVVEGEGGLRLTRAAMERATPDYMQWGALREMHQPQAAGTTTEIQWDEQGAYIRTRIVDDAAWKKVVERVYKGFSVGVQGLVLRGNQVTACRWIEISLVDRPKDPGAVITADIEAAENDEPNSRTASVMTRPTEDGDVNNDADAPHLSAEITQPDYDAMECGSTGNDDAHDYAADLPRGIAEPIGAREANSRAESTSNQPVIPENAHGGFLGSPDQGCRAAAVSPTEASSIRHFENNNGDLTHQMARAEEITPDAETDDAASGHLARHIRAFSPVADFPAEGLPAATSVAVNQGAGECPLPATELNRLARANAQLLQRAEMAETELATVRAQLGAATERARFLEAQPKPAKPVVRFPGALQRDFIANHAAGENAGRVAELRAERAALLATAPSLTTQADRATAAQRLMAIDGELRMISA